MTDILGPANAQNATTVRPADTRVFGATDTWCQDCTTPSAGDGTVIQSGFLNGILGQLRDAIRGKGVTEDNDDDMLLRAIDAARDEAVATVLASLQATVRVYPEITTNAGLLAFTSSTGQIVVNTGQFWTWRGVKSFGSTSLTLGERTFTTTANRTYHLVWHPPGFGTATPAATYPNGRFELADMTALTETDAIYDSGYDRMLVARIVTNGSNALTVTPLLNRNVLKASAELQLNLDRQLTFASLAGSGVALNWARRPVRAVPALALVAAVNSSGLGSNLDTSPEGDLQKIGVRFALAGLSPTRYAVPNLQYMYDDVANNDGLAIVTWIVDGD